MASTELDPLFVKGLRLLHSKSRESTEQLKQLLDDVIAQSKQSVHSKDRIYTSVKSESDNKIHIKKASREASEATSFSSKYSSEDTRDRKADKRQLEKAKQEPAEVEAKIPKLEPPQVYSYYPSSPDIPKLDQYVSKKEEESDSSEENADADDFAMEMGLACVICKQLDVTQGNQLIECQECHSLYHQECHRPPATDYDYNDPRRVWYCAKCVKNMKKMATKTQKTVKSGVTVSSKEPVAQAKGTRSEGSPPALILPFKRTELKPTPSQGNNQTSANKPIGLAGLAANFGSGRTSASSSAASLAPATRGTKTTTVSSLNLKTPFSSTTTKTSLLTTSSSLLTKIPPPSSSFSNLSTTAQSSSGTSSQKSLTTTSVTKGLGLLSAAAAASSSRSAAAVAPSGNGGGGAAASSGGAHKVPSCSPLMSADKRLQIMKKKASKMQERRRLSNK